MTIDNMLNKTALVERQTLTYTESADPSSEWTPVESDVPCALEASFASVRFTAGGPTIHCTHRAFFKCDADVQPEDRVTIDTHTYLVVLASDAAGRGHHLEVLLKG